MRIKINDTWVILPSSLSEITLKQRIDFQKQYGDELDVMAQSISQIEDPTEKELESYQYILERAFRTVAFFVDCSVEAIKESKFVDEILNIYLACFSELFKQENEIALQEEFVWNSEIWRLSSPYLKYGDEMTFGEMIDAKQTIQDLSRLEKGRWEILLPLCAIYLRKDGEAYDKSFLYEGSDRLKLMESLPLNIAIQVGFFLNNSLIISTGVSQSFTLPGLRALGKISKSTLIALDG